MRTTVEIEFKGELDCGKCKIKDCFKPFSKYDFCPRVLITKKSQYYILLYTYYKDGHLLRAGGVADQPREYLQAMDIIKAEINRLKYPDPEDGEPKGSGSQNRNQPIGEYCKGRDIEECKKYFGDGLLKRVCETCPN